MLTSISTVTELTAVYAGYLAAVEQARRPYLPAGLWLCRPLKCGNISD